MNRKFAFMFCRSPRHSIMLTRRHSFYTDGSYENCRTVNRAKIVHQHKEAVPPTPRIDSSVVSTSAKKSSIFSPKSLLFSNVSSSQKHSSSYDSISPVNMLKTRRRLRLNSESKSESRLSALCSKKSNQSMSSTSNDSSIFQKTIRKTPKKRVKFDTIFTEGNSIVDDELPFKSYQCDSTT